MGDSLLVTGASGLVGANLVRTLLEQGRNIRAMIHKDRRALDGLEVETITADVRDQASVERAMTGIEVVYHLAGSISLEMDSGPEMMEVNTIGTRLIVNACLKYGVRRLVHFSSIDALKKGSQGTPVDEEQPLVDASLTDNELSHIPPYDLSKAKAEREVIVGVEHGLDTVIIRPTAMLGPYDFKPSFIGQALLRLANGRIPALVKAGFDWVDVRDVVRGAICAERNALPGTSYMLGGNWHTIREVAKIAAAFSQRSAPRLTVPFWLADAFAPVMLKLASFNNTQPIYTRVTLEALRGDRHVNSARAERELGYTARPLSESVWDTLRWFQENGYQGEKTH